ncbi:hypothetical protein [Alkalihalophilus marmarensis]|uniref:hypothetical protein n=1 Tax=Alkalihalophilus marmarensis TaxID=521377 RepID=UPI002E1D074D|nr:hypothetical protein [Alkalihalophilus marmarensis]
MSYQDELEKAINKLTNKEKESFIYEVCLIANRGNPIDKQFIEADIQKTIDLMILKKG